MKNGEIGDWDSLLYSLKHDNGEWFLETKAMVNWKINFEQSSVCLFISKN